MATEVNTVFWEHKQSRNGCILFLEDQEQHAVPWIVWFTEKGWDVFWFRNAEDAISYLDQGDRWDQVDIAVLDQRVDDHPMQGLEFADVIRTKKKSFARCVILTGQADSIPDREKVRRAKEGRIVDIFSKSVEKQELLERLLDLQDFANRLRDVRRLERERATQLEKGLTNIHGDTLKDTDKRVSRCIGPSLKNVVILGDTGTGKEEMARRVHVFSGLAKVDGEIAERYRNFRVLNCAAISDQLLLSQMFGHVKGSFTDASEHRLGAVLEAAGLRHVQVDGRSTATPSYDEWLWECARKGLAEILGKQFRNRWTPGANDDESTLEVENSGELPRASHVKVDDRGCMRFVMIEKAAPRGYGGTLFLDEVADLSSYAQAALLRFLDGNGFQPLGYYGPPICPKVRVIAATNRDDVLFGKSPGFRPDLLWRLRKWVIRMPPISKRGREPLAVAEAMAKGEVSSIRFDDEALQLLETWITGGTKGESRFSGSTPEKTGNYRSLEALVQRAAWIAKTDDDADENPLITKEILEEASEISIDMTVNSNEQTRSGDAAVRFDHSKEELIKRAIFLNEDCEHDPSQFSDAGDELRQDRELVSAFRDLFRGSHGLALKKLFDDPVDGLSVPIGNPGARERWQYLCILGILAAAKLRGDRDLWYHTRKVIGGKTSTAADHAKGMLEKVLESHGIKAVWSSNKASRGPGIIGDFLRLLAEQQILLSKSTQDSVLKHDLIGTQFHWTDDITNTDQVARSKRFLSHMARVAEHFGLVAVSTTTA